MSGSRPATLWRKVKDFFLQRADSSAVNAFMELGEKRRAALEAVANGRIHTDGDSASVPLTQQGDLTMYSMDALNLRRKLSRHPFITKLMRQHWLLMVGHKPVHEAYLNCAEYVLYFKSCSESLAPEDDIPDHLIEAEWEKDANGQSRMDFALFCAALYELVDQWTATVSLTDYTDMLTALYESVRLKLTTLGYIQSRPSRLPFIPTDESEAISEDVFAPASNTSNKSPRDEIVAEENPSPKPITDTARPYVDMGPVTGWQDVSDADDVTDENLGLKGLPPHTCEKKRKQRRTAHSGGGGHEQHNVQVTDASGFTPHELRCDACKRIAEWEKHRRELLERFASEGAQPWLGAWAVKPDTYSIPLDASNIDSMLPVDPPGASSEPAWLPPGCASYLTTTEPDPVLEPLPTLAQYTESIRTPWKPSGTSSSALFLSYLPDYAVSVNIPGQPPSSWWSPGSSDRPLTAGTSRPRRKSNVSLGSYASARKPVHSSPAGFAHVYDNTSVGDGSPSALTVPPVLDINTAFERSLKPPISARPRSTSDVTRYTPSASSNSRTPQSIITNATEHIDDTLKSPSTFLASPSPFLFGANRRPSASSAGGHRLRTRTRTTSDYGYSVAQEYSSFGALEDASVGSSFIPSIPQASAAAEWPSPSAVRGLAVVGSPLALRTPAIESPTPANAPSTRKHVVRSSSAATSKSKSPAQPRPPPKATVIDMLGSLPTLLCSPVILASPPAGSLSSRSGKALSSRRSARVYQAP